MGRVSLRRLKEVLVYEPETGIFRWRVARKKCSVGGPAGAKHPVYGYIRVTIDGQGYPAHVLAFVYMKGRWPRHEVDHENRTRDDNRWSNLREATSSQNRANSPAQSRSSSGYRGVTLHKPSGLWHSRVNKQGRMYSTGYHRTPEAAARARDKKAIELFGEFAFLNFPRN